MKVKISFITLFLITNFCFSQELKLLALLEQIKELRGQYFNYIKFIDDFKLENSFYKERKIAEVKLTNKDSTLSQLKFNTNCYFITNKSGNRKNEFQLSYEKNNLIMLELKDEFEVYFKYKNSLLDSVILKLEIDDSLIVDTLSIKRDTLNKHMFVESYFIQNQLFYKVVNTIKKNNSTIQIFVDTALILTQNFKQSNLLSYVYKPHDIYLKSWYRKYVKKTNSLKLTYEVKKIEDAPGQHTIESKTYFNLSDSSFTIYLKKNTIYKDKKSKPYNRDYYYLTSISKLNKFSLPEFEINNPNNSCVKNFKADLKYLLLNFDRYDVIKYEYTYY